MKSPSSQPIMQSGDTSPFVSQVGFSMPPLPDSKKRNRQFTEEDDHKILQVCRVHNPLPLRAAVTRTCPQGVEKVGQNFTKIADLYPGMNQTPEQVRCCVRPFDPRVPVLKECPAPCT